MVTDSAALNVPAEADRVAIERGDEVLRQVKVSGRVEVVCEPLTGAALWLRSVPYARMSGYSGGDPDPLNGGGGPRGRVREFSRASRARLVLVACRLLAALVSRESGFASLTYGAEFPAPEVSKRHLEALRERLRRSWSHVFGLWVLERQRRDAPHFHLVLSGFVSESERDRFGSWLAAAWLDLSGAGGSSPGDRERYGCHWRPVTSAGELVSYLTSELSGRKLHQKSSGSWEWSGRWWGYIRRDLVVAESVPVEVRTLGVEVLGARLVDVDRVMRPAPRVMRVEGASVTFPATTVRHHAARYVATGDPAHLVDLANALARSDSGAAGGVLDPVHSGGCSAPVAVLVSP